MPSNSKDYQKKYYEENRTDILTRMRQPLLCEACNTHVSRSNFPKHLVSNKHIRIAEMEQKKQITMTMLTDQITEVKKLIGRVETLGINNTPEKVLRRVFGSLGKHKKEEPTKVAPESEIDSESDTN